jgi:hypothetical protein
MRVTLASHSITAGSKSQAPTPAAASPSGAGQQSAAHEPVSTVPFVSWSFADISILPGPFPVRAKLDVSAPEDDLEVEAEAAADRVMRSAKPAPAPGGCACAGGDPCPKCRDRVQRRADRSGNARVPGELGEEAMQAALTGGAPLPDAERSFFESRLQHDFKDVRVHTGAPSANLARAINARAFTVGPHIAFAEGSFRPGTDAGRRLLAHELAHVIQAGVGAPRSAAATRPIRRVSPESPRLARRVLRTPDPRLEQLLRRVRELGGAVGSLAATEQVERLFSVLRGVDLADPDNLAPISQAVSAAFSDDVLLLFLQRVDMQFRPGNRPDPTSHMRVRGSPYLGPGGVGLFPHLGAAAYVVTTTASMMVRSSGAYLDGLIDGLRGGISQQELDALTLRLSGTGVLNTVFPVPFLAGAVVGIGRDVVSTIQSVIEIVGNFSEVVEHFRQLIAALLEDPGAARAMGHETGQQFAQRLGRMSGENIIVFAYHLGELVGPTIVYTVISALGLPEIAGAVIFARIAAALRGFPRVARILEALALRLRRRSALGRAAEAEAPHAPRAGRERAEAPRAGGERAEAPHGEGPERRHSAPGARRVPAALCDVCRLGTLLCTAVPTIITDAVGSCPHPTRVPAPTGPFHLRGLTDPDYLRLRRQSTRDFMQRLYLAHPEVWTPEFQAAYTAAGHSWPRTPEGAWQVHHRKPLDFGGDNSIANFYPLEQPIHAAFTTYWQRVKREFARYFTDEDWREIIGGARSEVFVPPPPPPP